MKRKDKGSKWTLAHGFQSSIGPQLSAIRVQIPKNHGIRLLFVFRLVMEELRSFKLPDINTRAGVNHNQHEIETPRPEFPLEGLTLSRTSPRYESVWELLPIRHRQALIALANLSPGDKLFSGAVVQKYGLASAPTFRKALKGLVEKGLADREQHKYSIIDVFFKKWIQTNFVVK